MPNEPRFRAAASVAPVAAPLDFATFWANLGKVVVRMVRQRAHGTVTITLHGGDIPLVEVANKYKPGGLPDV